MRNWDALGQNTRTRYERAGISRGDYESGASLKGARGHAETPERPSEAEKHPERYRSYVTIRNDIKELKRELYGPNAKPNIKKGSSRAHLMKVREILENKRDYTGSWSDFWEDNDQWDRDDYAEVEYYH